MDTTIFLWALSSTFFAGLQMFMGKVIAHHKGDSALNSLLTYSVSASLSVVLWLLHPSIPNAWQVITFFAVASGLIHGVGNILRMDSLRHIDSTIFFPLNKILGPLFVVFGGVYFLSERFTPEQIIGIALSLLVPVLLVSRTEKHRQNNLNYGLILLVISTVFTSVAIVLAKQGAVQDSNALFMVFMCQVGGIFMSLATYLYQKKHLPHLDKLKIDSFSLKVGVLSGIFAFGGFYSMITALHAGSVSLVYTINAHYILIPIFLSVWWYGEHMDMRKFAAVVLSCITITLLY